MEILHISYVTQRCRPVPYLQRKDGKACHRRDILSTNLPLLSSPSRLLNNLLFTCSQWETQLPITTLPSIVLSSFHSINPRDFSKQVSVCKRGWGIQVLFLLIRLRSHSPGSCFKSCQWNLPTAEINVNGQQRKDTVVSFSGSV